MAWNVVSDLPNVEGYNLPELAERALGLVGESEGNRTVVIDRVINHKSKLRKCFRIMAKYGIVENLQVVSETYRDIATLGFSTGYVDMVRDIISMDVRQDFMDKVADGMALPNWPVQKLLIDPVVGQENGTAKTLASLSAIQSFHLLSFPDQYTTYDIALKMKYSYQLGQEGKVVRMYVPTVMVEDVARREYLYKVRKFLENDLTWLARNLYGLHYKEVPKTYGEEEVSLLTLKDDLLLKGLVNTVRVIPALAESHMNNLPFAIKMRDEAREHGEGFRKHLLGLYVAWMNDHAVTLMNSKGDLLELVEGFLSGEHLRGTPDEY